jgi:hypothetical protein
MRKYPYPIATLYGLRARINPAPDYHLRGYGIPKMYWQRLPADGRPELGVIDGHTTLSTGQIACHACNTHALATR